MKVQPGGEESLNDVVVQVVGNAFAIGQDGQLTFAGSRGGQGQRNRGVAGEVAHQFQIARVECGVVLVAGHRDDADDRILGAQRHHDRRSLAGVGERLDGVPEGLRDDRAAGP